jgi:hypothetical protein
MKINFILLLVLILTAFSETFAGVRTTPPRFKGASRTVSSNSANDFDGYWQTKDREDLLLIQKEKGIICASDVKSSAYFLLNGDVMGDYDYGGNDTLALSKDGKTLTRVGLDHGEKYVIEYSKVEAIPKFCIKQGLSFDDTAAFDCRKCPSKEK